MAVLGQPLRTWFSDAREDLGLAHLGAHGTQSRVELPAMLTMPPLPAGIVSTDLVILDGWTEIEIATDFDPNMGGLFPLTYGMAGALFDSAISSPTYRENFRIDPGVWQDEYLPGDLTAAMFDGATTSQEDFDSTLWPDWLWP
jgi:hypothetical protein